MMNSKREIITMQYIMHIYIYISLKIYKINTKNFLSLKKKCNKRKQT